MERHWSHSLNEPASASILARNWRRLTKCRRSSLKVIYCPSLFPGQGWSAEMTIIGSLAVNRIQESKLLDNRSRFEIGRPGKPLRFFILPRAEGIDKE